MRRLAVVVLSLVSAGGAQVVNLALNPGAEEVVDGRLVGWGQYTGSGQGTVTRSTAEKRSGEASTCFEVTGWYHAPDKPDTAQHRSVNLAVVLADNNGFTAQGALEGEPGTLYAVSFWYRGDLPAVQVRGMEWPTAEGDHLQRKLIRGLADTLQPGPEWRSYGATFKLAEDSARFSIQVAAVGQEREGYRLGKLYLDDVRIVPKAWPDGELRAAWWWGEQNETDREPYLARSAEMLDRLKAAGFNTVFLTMHSLYLAALERPELRAGVPGSDWDSFGEVLNLAAERGLAVHAWYPPWTYKRKGRSAELLDHPEWVAVRAGGTPTTDTVCFVRPESRQYQLDLLRGLLLRYPALAGLHLEEPGHPTCHCDYCVKLAREWLGLDIVADHAGSEASLRQLAAFMNGDFFARLRQTVNSVRPEVWLSANGSAGDNPDWNIARDWPTWSKRGYLDFYVPQIYTEDVPRFERLLEETRGALDGGDLVAGMAVSWTRIYPRRQDPANLVAEIRAARQQGAKGIVVFRAALLEDAHWDALRPVLGER